MTKKTYPEAQTPLILNCHRLMEAFAKSNDERDFYLDKVEGFILYADLDKDQGEIEALEKEVAENPDRYFLVQKFTFYETKKIMEGFVHEKVYDIDTKEKLIEIIQSKEARENFLEFIFDHHTEFEKWQQFYQERSRIRIIEWLRHHNFQFVFEEDVDFTKSLIEKIKQSLFESKVGKDIAAARKTLFAKAKTYYSNEALNPRPKRGRPPKQTAKLELEPQYTVDIYITIPPAIRSFLFAPDMANSASWTFSAKFDNEESFLSLRQGQEKDDMDVSLKSLNEKLATLRTISSKWVQEEQAIGKKGKGSMLEHEEEILKEFEEEDEDEPLNGHKMSKPSKKVKEEPAAKKKAPAKRIMPEAKPALKKNGKPVKRRITKN